MMISTKPHLSRRTVLRGVGATLALPLLDSMVPAHTRLRATAAASPTRFVAIEMVHGAAGSTAIGRARHYWSPVKDGRDFDFTDTLRSLEPLREYVTVISDTALKNAMSLAPTEDGDGADHARSSAVFLTAAHPRLTGGSDIQAGPSIDQVIARRIGRATRIASLQLCIEDEDVDPAEATCGHGYSCWYSRTISWASPTRPLPMERRPRMVFEQLFGDSNTRGHSILDQVSDDAAGLQRRLGPGDRARVEAFLADIRAVERRIQAIEHVPDSFDEHVSILFELQRLAFSADITRVVAFKLGTDRSARIYPESGIDTPFHALSHHREDPRKVETFAALNQYHVSTVARFLQRLRDTADGDGHLLDHAAVLYGSPMGDSHVHDHRALPLFVAGRATGRIRGNQHVRCAEGTSMGNVLLTLARKFGVDVDRIGDSTGEVDLT